MSSIKEKLREIKEKEPKRLETLVTLLIIISTATLGYGIGKISAQESHDSHVKIEQVSLFENSNTANTLGGTGDLVATEQGEVVGSRNSDKYHYPWCSGAKRISDANKVWFKTIEEAKQAGYKPAGNCPGLE